MLTVLIITNVEGGRVPAAVRVIGNMYDDPSELKTDLWRSEIQVGGNAPPSQCENPAWK